MSVSILIAGYYRSGTSALSGALNLAGVAMVNTDERNEHNPRGYFEDPVLIRRDLDLLRRLDREWHDIRPMPDGWWQRPDIGKDTHFIAAELTKHFRNTPLWGVKHPHLCRLLPIYAQAAEQLSGCQPRVIHIYRDPWMVAHSQFKKNRLSMTHALLLWSSHVLDAERYARPLRRAVLDYETLVNDSARAIRKVGDDLEIVFPGHDLRDVVNINRFLTPQLRRSTPRGRARTPDFLRTFVEDLFTAAVSAAEPEVFDALRVRFDGFREFIDDLASTSLSVTGEFRRGPLLMHRPPHSVAGKTTATGSTLRPPEHSDEAERNRVTASLATCEYPASLDLIVAVPAGRLDAAYDTATSVDRQWRQPRSVTYLCADPAGPDKAGWMKVPTEPGELTREVARYANASTADYVTVVEAGNLLEPDAIARMTLFVDAQDRPALVYADEIVADRKTPWVRNKPDFDIERLRNLYYLGCSPWISTAWFKTVPMDGTWIGTEDYDLALRLWEANARICHVPDALLTWKPGSVRDVVTEQELRDNATNVLKAHLERCGSANIAGVVTTPMPGLFHIRYRVPTAERTSLVLFCDEVDKRYASELDRARITLLADTPGIEHLIIAGSRKSMHPKMLEALQALSAAIGHHARVEVIIEDTPATTLARVIRATGTGLVVTMTLDLDVGDPSWLGHLTGKLRSPGQRVVAVSAAVQREAEDGKPRAVGPLLLGAGNGCGALVANRLASDPGPGAWLATAASVDGVLPLCAAFDGATLQSITPDAALSGAALWMDVGLQLRAAGGTVVWDPAVQASCQHVPQTTSASSAEDLVIRERWGCTSAHHHPRLALQGDALGQLRADGLYAPTPRGIRHFLLSGDVTGAEYPIQWLRELRFGGLATASWAAEPLPITELRRLSPDAWVRVNPRTAIDAPDAPKYVAMFTRPSASSADALRRVGGQARHVVATSPGLAELLATHSGHVISAKVVTPTLARRLWHGFSSDVNRDAVRILWVDEGDRPGWMTQLLSSTHVAWFIVENGKTRYDGPIATLERPSDEDGWVSLFQSVRPHMLIRPVSQATWLDCGMLLRAAAAGAVPLADARLHWPKALSAMAVEPKYDAWRKAIKKLSSDPEALAALGHEARESIERVGWLEDDGGVTRLIDSGTPSIETAYA